MKADEALGLALRWLGRRPMTEAELRRKLLASVPKEAVEAAVARLKAWGYLDDRAYAEAFVRARRGRWGVRKLRHELLRRGVAPGLADAVLSGLEGQAVEEALLLLKKHAWRHKNDRARAVRFLVGRGYPVGVALEAFERLQEEG